MSRVTKLSMLASVANPFSDPYFNCQTTSQNSQTVLWYQSPAPIWDRALPIGNGRLGDLYLRTSNWISAWFRIDTRAAGSKQAVQFPQPRMVRLIRCELRSTH